MLSIVTDAASVFAARVFPAASATLPAASRSTTVPSLLHVTVTVIVLPLSADGVNVEHVAVPLA